jgi:integrase
MAKGRKVRGVFFRDGQWWIRWACSLGHDHRNPSGTEKTAATEEHKAKRAEVREARKAGRECCPRLVRRERPLLFEEVIADFMEHSRRTKRSYTNDKIRAARFLALFSGRMASDITTKEIEDFRADMMVERKIATVNLYLKFLKAAYNRAIRQGRLTFNPLAPMLLQRENNARNRCLSPEEEVRLMKALSPRLRAMVAVALHTGMRRGELRRLMWADVDFDTGTIRVGLDKAGDGRWVVMNSVAREALLAAKREQRVLGPYVFSSPEGKFLHNFERYWRPALKAVNIPDFRFHDLRHTFASRLAMKGVDLYTVQRAGGWKTTTMVQRYAHLSPDHMRAAVEKLAQGVSSVTTGTRTGTLRSSS